MVPFKKYVPQYAVELGIQLILLFFLALYFLKIQSHIDFDPTDETLYLWHGIQKNFANTGWASLYSLWYSFLYTITQKPVQALFLNIYLISFFLLPLLIFQTARHLDLSLFSSLGLSFLISTTTLNLNTFPRLQVFNFVFLLAAFLLSRTQPPNKMRLFLFYFLMAISLYIRQENIFIFVLFFIFDLIQLRKNPQLMVVLFMSAGLALLIPYGLLKSPFSQNRLFQAFEFYYSIRHQFELNGRSVSEAFFKAQSFTECLFRAPELIFKHILNNFLPLLQNFFQELSLKSLSNGPDWQQNSSNLLYFLLGISFFLTSPSPKKNLPLRKNFLFFSFAIAFRTITTSLLLYPDRKYLLELVFIFPILVYLLLPHISLRLPNFFPQIALGLIAVIGILQIIKIDDSFFYQQNMRTFVKAFDKIGLRQEEFISGPAENSPVLLYSKYWNHSRLKNPYNNRKDFDCENGDWAQFYQAEKAQVIVIDAISVSLLGPSCVERIKGIPEKLNALGLTLSFQDPGHNNFIFIKKPIN